MTTFNLDDLNKCLRLTADQAQASFNHQHAKGLSKYIEVDSDGQPRAIVWQCHLPLVSGQEHRYEILRIPWTDFYNNEPTTVSELSMDFLCEIKQKRPQNKELPNSYTVVPSSDHDNKNSRRDKHHCLISLKKEYDWQTEIIIDDIPIKEFLMQCETKPEMNNHSFTLKRNSLTTIIIVLILVIMMISLAVY